LSHVVINSLHDARGLLLVHIANAVFAALAALTPSLHRVGENAAGLALGTLVLVSTMAFVWLLGTASHVQMYLTLVGALLLFIGTQNWKVFLGYFALFTVALMVALHYGPREGLIEPQDTSVRDMLTNEVMVNVMVVNAAIIFYAVAALQRAQIELENAYERSEALVTAVIPQPIALRLKAKPDERVADRIECLSILFADLVGFTKAAHELPPDEIVAYLDGLVRSFDVLCDELGAEKIKTIGDCYMAVAGIDGDGPGGARAVGRLALAMLEYMERSTSLGGERLRLRVGLHAGPATAGIIGDMRFSYDVWGDAVNVAARMESHGVPDRIHVTAEFRAIANGAFRFEERGTMDIRSIGPIRTFFLVAENDAIRPQAPSHPSPHDR
jgi:adenylate cyclase